MKKQQLLVPFDSKARQKLREAWLKKSLSDPKIQIPLPEQCCEVVTKRIGCLMIVHVKEPENKALILEKIQRIRQEKKEQPIILLRGYRDYEESESDIYH